MWSVSIQTADFDVSAELAALRSQHGDAGAVCSFVGAVRGHVGAPDGPAPPDAVLAMELEHYPGMTERAIGAILHEACQRFEVLAARVVHRVGRLQPMDQIVLVAVATRHRGSSFLACELVMDYLKTQAPFWKKEYTPLGARWVDARESDGVAAARWAQSPTVGGTLFQDPRPQ